ncbi:NTP transferase domain-containing protein [Microbacter sp. GSS18]|nr:NTP transferase domain-containing protein [Microbacter sp. GSS18]
MSVAAILLAGGRATRLGGADKPLLRVGDETLLDAAIAAVRAAGSAEIVAVGPDRGRDVTAVREDPPYAGPAAAVVAGLRALETDPEWVFVLACDLPHVREAVRFLADAVALVPADTEGVCLADSTSRPQWLTGVYRTRALRAAASALPDDGRDAPVRALVAELAVAALADPGSLSADVDTWDDAARHGAVPDASTRARIESADGGSRRRNEEVTMSDQSATLPPEALDEWAEALRSKLGLTADQLPVAAILDLARDAAHGVARPAAPVGAFAAGVAAGLAGGDPDAVARSIGEVVKLARGAEHIDEDVQAEESVDTGVSGIA